MNPFVLGTANLAGNYGRRQGSVFQRTAFAILDAAWDVGIRAFDTSPWYGEAFLRFNRWIGSRAHGPDIHVCYKLFRPEPLPVGVPTPAWPLDARHTLLMTHGLVRDPFWSGYVTVAGDRELPIGQSVYTDEMYDVIALPDVARIQVPLNAFDLRAVLTRNAMQPMRPLDFRSVFLQGTLLERPDDAERRAPGTGQLAGHAQEAARALGLPCEELLLAAALTARTNPQDRVIIAADSPRELHEIIRAVDIRPADAKAFLHLLQAPRNDVSIDTLDPRTWKAMAAATS